MFLFRKLSRRSGLSSTGQDKSNLSNHCDADFSKQALDQASKLVSEDDYEEALWILERLEQIDPGFKGVAELTAVAEVCNAASLGTCACPRESRNPDWYKVLKVDEKSELSSIKKRYRHLALLLHPDKNKHLKAEAAFKLVSEAYACLSDKKKREFFNMKRSFTKCKRCTIKNCAASGSDRWSGYNILREKAGLRRPGSSPDLTQTDWILDQERLRMFRARARARVFGNLEKVWKERGFTGLEETSIVKEGFNKNPKHEIKMNINLDRSKTRTSETNQEKDNTLTDHFAVVGTKDLGTEKNRIDAIEQKKVSHPQLFRPCKNLGVLIRDLQADFISSTKSKQCQNDEQDVASQKSIPENYPIADDRDPETLVQDGHGMLDAMSGVHIQGNCMDYFPGTLKAVVCNHMCANGFLDKGSNALENEAPQPNDIVSKQRFDEVFMCNIRKEHDLKFEEPEVVNVMESQALQENDLNGERQNEDCTNTVARKHVQCRQTRRDDSLDLEETILRTQREKSEQLLKMLQRLQEETRTVAASLNHLRTGCS